MSVTTQRDGGAADLVSIIQAYNDVTVRLKQSHELLTREVCRLREELHEKNKELRRRERLAALGQMAAGVAHEIRNPLGGIELYASLLERDLADRPEQRDIVGKVRMAVRNIEHIVGDILAFAGEGALNRRLTPLGPLLDRVVAQTAPLARSLGARVEVEPDLARVELDCDPSRIERALLNLVFNALDAAGERGHVRLRAGLSSDARGGCRIIVEDNGPGIPPDQLQCVFDPFYTTKDSGTGLGLAIVHRIAESHGGYVRAGRRTGGGASFELFLPPESLPQHGPPVCGDDGVEAGRSVNQQEAQASGGPG